MSPETVAPMVPPSFGSQVAFVAIVLGIVLAFLYAVRRTGQARGDAPKRVARDVRRAGLVMVAYLAITAGVASSGMLGRSGSPPPLMSFLVACNLVALTAAVSPLGLRFAQHLPIAAIVGFQAFRLPLELVLHRWYVEGVLPVTMTYAGRNFDIVSGLLALPLTLWAWKGAAPGWAIAGYTVLGLGLLLRVASLAVLSSPLPLRLYFEGPPVQLAAYVPTVWIVPLCVGGALAGHVVALLWLRIQRA